MSAACHRNRAGVRGRRAAFAGQRRFQDTAGALSGQRTYRYPAVLASSWLNFEFAGKGLGVELRSGLDAQDAYFSLSPGPFK
jgi:hypothetical protein